MIDKILVNYGKKDATSVSDVSVFDVAIIGRKPRILIMLKKKSQWLVHNNAYGFQF